MLDAVDFLQRGDIDVTVHVLNGPIECRGTSVQRRGSEVRSSISAVQPASTSP